MVNDLAIQDFVNAIKEVPTDTNTTYQATVSRIDDEGVVWVNLYGSEKETPTTSTSSEVKRGDSVTVQWRNNKLYIGGNYSNPSAGIARVDKAQNTADVAFSAANDAVSEAQRASMAADAAEASAQSAATSASNAMTAAQSAQASADSALVSLSNVEDVVGVLEWITAHGTMTANGSAALDPSKVYFVRDNNGDYHVGSYYYSIVAEPKAEDRSTYYTLSVDESVQNYVATHVAVDTEGLWLIPDSGGNKVLIATGAGSSYTTAGTYIIGKVNGVDTVFAKFTTDGVTMNATNSTQIAHLGYGSGNAESGTATAPYYALGIREGAVGNYSVVEGKGTTINNVYYPQVASGFCSHAEGAGNTASGWESHAEGAGNTASGDHAHAEGYLNTASGFNSHAEGQGTTSSGNWSHTQGYGTEASRLYQTALGTYNEVDGTGSASKGNYILIIGNGTADNARSNAFTIDWNGNVNIASGAKYKINGTNLSASDVGALSTSDKYTRSSAGTLDWTNNAEGDTKIMMKSGVAYWNGAYSGTSSNLKYSANGEIIGTNTATSKTTFPPTSGSSYSNYGGCYYEKWGKVVHVHIGVSGLTASTATDIYTLPTGYRPTSPIFTYGTSGSWNSIAYVEIRTDGVINVRSVGNYCGADVSFMV